MNRDECKQCLQTIHATAEILGQELKPAAVSLMVQDLREYPANEVNNALTRCRAEIKGRLTLSAIIERIPSANAFPTPNEAWAIALGSIDENDTVIWTGEISEAMGASQAILDIGDKVGARMAFVEKYQKLIDASKSEGKKPVWAASLGCDPARRENVINEGVRKGLLPPQDVENLLPPPPAREQTAEDKHHASMMIQMLRDVLDAPDMASTKKRAERLASENERRNELIAQADELEAMRNKA